MPPLYLSLKSRAPTIDAELSLKYLQYLCEQVHDQPLNQVLQYVWPAIGPVFVASPYLWSLARKDAHRLVRLLVNDPKASLQTIFAATENCAVEPNGPTAEQRLRMLKSELHLLTALADLGGVWPLSEVTAALSGFADRALATAMHLAARTEKRSCHRQVMEGCPRNPIPGLFCIALGKHGAMELNYSSDIDFVVFFDPEIFAADQPTETHKRAVKLVESIVSIIQRRTPDGYVFRVDLRLRPDPLSTSIALSTTSASIYYESYGQNWERAAFIKARVAAGDLACGKKFLESLTPFIWRRNLDFAAITDIQGIKRQIHQTNWQRRGEDNSIDLKLANGGIREIELFVQTQQLILGGRHRSLRLAGTIEALLALANAGFVTGQCANDLSEAYIALREWEHRIQMISDEQTHRLPADNIERMRVATLAGYKNLRDFDAEVARTMKIVAMQSESLFANEHPQVSDFGSLNFSGPVDHPETLATLGRMGYRDPKTVSETIRGWHLGRIAATRTERGRQLLARLAPLLIEAARLTGAPDTAFARFSAFFSGLTVGVQVQALFIAKPRLLELIVRIMAFAPQFARALARRSGALDALLDAHFFDPIRIPEIADPKLKDDLDFETAMNIARRTHREYSFRIGVQVLAGDTRSRAAGQAFTQLADRLISFLAQASLEEVIRKAGWFDGEVAVIALGKCGSREMNARSDLDLMMIYRSNTTHAASAKLGLSADTFYARFTQRLIAALSAPTAEGELYDVDLQLRPSGNKGPIAVSMDAFESYYARGAEIWEFLALTRSRVVWATSPLFGTACSTAIEAMLRKPRERVAVAREVLEMRALMSRERPAKGRWDLKLSDGGLVDVEFAAQFLQLVQASEGGPLMANTDDAIAALSELDAAPRPLLRRLRQAWDLQQNLSQLLKVALEEDVDPRSEPFAFLEMLAAAGKTKSFSELEVKLERVQVAAHDAFVGIVR